MSISTILILAGMVSGVTTQTPFATDTLTTSEGDLKITFIGHGSLLFTFNRKTIYIDPYGKMADYGKLPKADLILVTHDHPDHLDPAAIRMIRTTSTTLLLTAAADDTESGGAVMKNGGTRIVHDIRIEAVPAYNLVHTRPDGQPFHPKGEGNGYILTFGDTRVYVAGDTENIPEMKALTGIDVAFLPMNLPYTMTPEMVADAARAFRPAVLYPYHFGDTDPSKLADLLKDVPEIEIRIRRMK